MSTTLLTIVSAQIKWDGEAGDGLWTTPQNWLGNQVPAVTDWVIFDNSVLVPMKFALVPVPLP